MKSVVMKLSVAGAALTLPTAATVAPAQAVVPAGPNAQVNLAELTNSIKSFFGPAPGAGASAAAPFESLANPALAQTAKQGKGQSSQAAVAVLNTAASAASTDTGDAISEFLNDSGADAPADTTRSPAKPVSDAKAAPSTTTTTATKAAKITLPTTTTSIALAAGKSAAPKVMPKKAKQSTLIKNAAASVPDKKVPAAELQAKKGPVTPQGQASTIKQHVGGDKVAATATNATKVANMTKPTTTRLPDKVVEALPMAGLVEDVTTTTAAATTIAAKAKTTTQTPAKVTPAPSLADTVATNTGSSGLKLGVKKVEAKLKDKETKVVEKFTAQEKEKEKIELKKELTKELKNEFEKELQTELKKQLSKVVKSNASVVKVTTAIATATTATTTTPVTTTKIKVATTVITKVKSLAQHAHAETRAASLAKVAKHSVEPVQPKHLQALETQVDALKAQLSIERQLRSSAFNDDTDETTFRQAVNHFASSSTIAAPQATHKTLVASSAGMVDDADNKTQSAPSVTSKSHTLANGMTIVDMPWQQQAEPAQPVLAVVNAPLEPAHGLTSSLAMLVARAHRFLTSLVGVPDDWGTTTTTQAPAHKAALLQKPKHTIRTLLEKQNAARTAELVMEESLQNVAISNPWKDMETRDEDEVEDLSGADRVARVEAETPAKPHFLTKQEAKKRGEQHVHFGKTFRDLEQQDIAIQSTLNKMGDDSNLKVVGDITNIQDSSMATLTRQLANADVLSHAPRAMVLHGDTEPEAKLLHEPFMNLQKTDEEDESKINMDPSMKLA